MQMLIPSYVRQGFIYHVYARKDYYLLFAACIRENHGYHNALERSASNHFFLKLPPPFPHTLSHPLPKHPFQHFPKPSPAHGKEDILDTGINCL